MPWIRSESNLSRNPKTLALKAMLNIEMDALIGRLHFLWWWTLEYALDGDLSKKEPKVIEQSCQVPLKMLIKAGFVDARPYRRIHDWWDNQGAYLRSRYHKQPEIWQRIEKLYQRGLDTSMDMSSIHPRMSPVRRTDVQNGRTDVQDVRTDVHNIKGQSAGSGPSAPPAPNGKEEQMTREEMDEIKYKNMPSLRPR